MGKLRIGTTGNIYSDWQAKKTKELLEAIGIEAELVTIPSNMPADQQQALVAALLRGDIDMTVHPLEKLPIVQAEGLVIAGVGQRENPAEVLLVRSEAVDNQLFKLKNGATVGVSSSCQKAQLLGYRPDLRVVEFEGNPPSLFEKLLQNDFDGLVLAACDVARFELDLTGLTAVNLNVREFVPAAAQGVLAFRCCKNDLETRNLIKQHLHRPTVSAVTNVERKVLKLLGGDNRLPLGVYCELDANGNYHVWVALAESGNSPVRRVRLSQSTHLELAERVVAGLELDA